MKVLLLDGYNMLYRARSGNATFGDSAADNNSITYTFFRSLRHIVDTHKPDRVYFVLEGMPKEQILHILDTAQQFVSVTDPAREVKKVPLLRGKSVFNLFLLHVLDQSRSQTAAPYPKYVGSALLAFPLVLVDESVRPHYWSGRTDWFLWADRSYSLLTNKAKCFGTALRNFF